MLPDGSGRERVARNLHVDVMVDQVVVGTSRATHHECTDSEQRQMVEEGDNVDRTVERRHVGGQCRRPQTRPQKQLPTDRTVPTGQLRMRPECQRQKPVDPVVGGRVDHAARFGFFRLHSALVTG